MSPSPRSAPTGSGFRPEIQALRALAVSLVVLFHLWPERLTGGFIGVDIFFVISGYLITAHLARELEGTGRIALGRFWARRARRLLPAALLVLAVTMLAVVIVAPASRWAPTAVETIASALYVQNWLLAVSAVDYFGAESAATAVQHYWSLSVEEQFYLVWPLLLIAALAVLRDRRRAVLAVLVGVFVLSYAASIVSTAISAPFSYFATWSHAWEFALGGLVAIAEPVAARWASTGDRARRLLAATGWLGLGAVLASALLLTGDGPPGFPGWIAILPAGGAALIIMAASGMLAAAPVHRAVSAPPVRWLGEASYSVYLWHWPLIVLVPFAIARPLGTLDKLVVLAATLVLAELTRRFVENPVRVSSALRDRTGLSFAVAAAGMVVVVAASTAVVVVVDRAEQAGAERADVALRSGAACFAALAMLDADCDPGHVVDPRLGPAFAARDGVTAGLESSAGAEPLPVRCSTVAGTTVSECRRGPDGADTVVALVGDSHAAHFRPLLVDLAVAHEWLLLTYIRGACLPTGAADIGRDDRAECDSWKQDIAQVVADSGADVVVVSTNTQGFARANPEYAAVATAALAETLQRWRDAGLGVVALGDTPFPPFDNVPDCIAQSGTEVDPCSMTRAEALVDDPMLRAAQHVAGVIAVDPTPAICDARRCHSVVGGVIVFHDRHHLTTTFARSLRPLIEQPILQSAEMRTG